MHGRRWSCVSLLALWTLVGACGDGGKTSTSDPPKASAGKAGADDGAKAKADDGNENAEAADANDEDAKASADEGKAAAEAGEAEGAEGEQAEGGDAEGEDAEGEDAEGEGEGEGEGEDEKEGAEDGEAAAEAGEDAPPDPKAMLKEAKSKKTKDDRAMELFAEAEEAGAKLRDIVKAAKQRGDALFSDPERAKKFYEWAAEKDKKYPDPYFALAKQAVNQGEVEETKRLLKLVHERKGKKLLQQLQFDPMWEIVKDDPEVRGWYGG